ncbi:DNA polymerase III subunit gamma/tau [Buchnera aphidicola]|uniref:DNA polymerase III subunit gamma/tau n=1 Tax=Buchnera aphidicola (Stegophylla sp.) TaxID=2315800 RepID=A0A4D6YN45_9GAMM|nr:DNA polymerase III subunit gamma/tau [Buchnera aphidicola (Stegophylla sp.)]QCI26455.1 DNA polymerase III subunit gamma/tau [Buchnera aphidicola (Stegophylla sp.)]
MQYQILARKWRPNSFSEIMGQQYILTAIRNSFLLNKIHQSWILSGTRGTGKTTFARLLAKSLNCKTGIKMHPCQICTNCKDIQRGCFPDLIEIDAASKTKVEDIKELLDTIQYPPNKGKFKIYLIDEVHMLSKYSFNALLKNLEEPPRYVKFILATTEIEKIPQTIISRCIYFHFKQLTTSQITQHISNILNKEKIHFEKKAIKIIAQKSQGSIRDALNLSEQAIITSNKNITELIILNIFNSLSKKQTLKIIKYLFKKNISKLMLLLKKIYQSNVELNTVLTEILKILHNIIIFKKCFHNNNHIQSSYQKKIYKLSKIINYQDLKMYYNIVIQGIKTLKYVPNPKIAIEITILNILNI